MINLDSKDRRILYTLDINARRSYAEIGKACRLSPETTFHRIKNMEKSGVIKGYYTVIDVCKLGYINFRTYLRLQNTTPEIEGEINAYLANSPEVAWIVSVEGSWDMNMLVWVKTVYEYEKFWNRLKTRYGKYISDSWVSIITRLHNFRRSFLVGKYDTTPVEIIGENVQVDVDKIDMHILTLLSSNCRISTVKMARKCGLTSAAVQYRIKKLIRKKIIQGFRPFIDIDKIGYKYYKIHLYFNKSDVGVEKQLLNFSKLHPNIVYVDESIGGADMELEIEIEDDVSLRKLILDIRHRFPIIRRYDLMQYYNEKKLYVTKFVS